jgi:endonuclease-3
MRLRGSDPFRIAVGTVLSARTRDDRLLPVLRELFRRARGPQDILRISPAALRSMLRPLGFYRVKAATLRAFARDLLSRFGGRVPDTMGELLTLPGVGIKVAGIVLVDAFGRDAVSVDIHVHRILNRLGWVRTTSPEKTCEELLRTLPRRIWRHVNWNLVAFGQTLCLPRNPRCSVCPIAPDCPKIGVPAR